MGTTTSCGCREAISGGRPPASRSAPSTCTRAVPRLVSNLGRPRHPREPIAGDPRILGRAEFVAQLLHDAERRETETLRLARKAVDLATLGRHLGAKAEITDGEFRARRHVSIQEDHAADGSSRYS